MRPLLEKAGMYCKVPGCREYVERPLWICRGHAPFVPGPMKARVRAAYQQGGARSKVFRDVVDEAVRYVELAFLPVPDSDHIERSSGTIVCGACALPFHDHPSSARAEYLTVICGGRFVKL